MPDKKLPARLVDAKGISTSNGTGSDMTLTILGCGTLGTAILRGILTSHSALDPKSPISPTYKLNKPTSFIACITRPESAANVRTALGDLTPNLKILQNENVRGVAAADVVLLGCKPQMVRVILGVPGMREALAGKLLISILAGVPVAQIEEILYGTSSLPSSSPSSSFPDSNEDDRLIEDDGKGPRCRIVRVMPNTASEIGESMTVIATSTPPLPAHLSALVSWIFTSIGRVVSLSPHLMDASTALCGSGPAFFALMLEAMIDGAVAMGLPRKEAMVMAAQTMKGTAGLVLGGEHPALLRDKVTTPGGCTIGGLLVMEEGRVRGNIARAVREATVVASQLGKGVQGVNGTRF